MTNFLLFLVVVLLFMLYRELPARRFTEVIMLRAVKALEAIAKEMSKEA